MRRIAVVALVLMAISLSAAAKNKAAKTKDKRFEPVEVQASAVTGSYRGPAESYGLVLEQAADGTLRGNYVEMGSVAVLSKIVLNGSDFTARASFDDGSSRTINGTFAKRIFNGTTAFGIHMRSVPVEGMGMVDTFFERL